MSRSVRKANSRSQQCLQIRFYLSAAPITPMTINQIPTQYRVADLFSHIDMGFLNRRLAITALGPIRQQFLDRQHPGEDHMTVLGNDHLLVTMLIDLCTHCKAPPLGKALTLGEVKHMFMSTERLEPCLDIYTADRVTHGVHLEWDHGKPVMVAYHTRHIVSDTGKMTLADGYEVGNRQSIIGLLHDKPGLWEVEPIVIGAPWLDHPRNPNGSQIVWFGPDYGEILPEDIDEFARMSETDVQNAEQWLCVMNQIPEQRVKEAIAKLLNEPVKNDWGGEENDHFSSNVTINGRRQTAAFLLKGPARFQEMTPAMCGKNGDQIYRLTKGGANISVVQHSHLVGTAVRETLRALTVTPGRPRKFCIIDGQSTYKLLKAYGFLNM